MNAPLDSTVPVFSRKIRERALTTGAVSLAAVASASAQDFTYSNAVAPNANYPANFLGFDPKWGTSGDDFTALGVYNSSGSWFNFTSTGGYSWTVTPTGYGAFNAATIAPGDLIDGSDVFGSGGMIYSSGTFLVGFRNELGSGVYHYGWASLTFADHEITLNATSYNQAANAGIEAGVSAIPEPATTALAIGAAALAAVVFKRRYATAPASQTPD